MESDNGSDGVDGNVVILARDRATFAYCDASAGAPATERAFPRLARLRSNSAGHISISMERGCPLSSGVERLLDCVGAVACQPFPGDRRPDRGVCCSTGPDGRDGSAHGATRVMEPRPAARELRQIAVRHRDGCRNTERHLGARRSAIRAIEGNHPSPTGRGSPARRPTVAEARMVPALNSGRHSCDADPTVPPEQPGLDVPVTPQPAGRSFPMTGWRYAHRDPSGGSS